MTKVKRRRFTVLDIYKRCSIKDSMTQKQFKDNWDMFAEILVKEMIHNGECFKLPYLLGTLQIRKRKTQPRHTVDYHKTKMLGETIYINNKHSEGYYAFMLWDTKRPLCQMEYKALYKIELTRDNKRYLAKHIKSTNVINKYFEIT